MRETFRWNPYADQPHNVASRSQRFWRHFRYAGSYFSLFAENCRKFPGGWPLFRKYRREMYKASVDLGRPFGLSLSPHEPKDADAVACMMELGIPQSLIRFPSWEREALSSYEKLVDLLQEHKVEVTGALLQRRDDVLKPSLWKDFVEEVFVRFGKKCSFFEIGHAWNRTKWGVWNYKEYLQLARPAVELADKYGIKIVGPAVIDFEFHLYPPVLKEISFDKVSSLLYVDRVGPPENTQFGWDTAAKVALLKATVDVSAKNGKDLWITEVNWPLKDTGKHSPASGKPNVSEDQQADYLVRYHILTLASGFVERVYWWQLVAPGYGLIDTRGGGWRRRPGFFALKTMVAILEGSVFVRKIGHPDANLFSFMKNGEFFVVCWTPGQSIEMTVPFEVIRVVGRDGQEEPVNGNRVLIEGSPKYIFYETDERNGENGTGNMGQTDTIEK
jgi:hypothetical protein